METLRERRRTELIDQLRRIAHQHLVEHGPAALSLRAIARDAGISVSALYRYFADRDALLTDLLVRAFDDQADAVQAAVSAAAPHPAAASIMAALRAYRRWSVEHPADFGLAYGSPVPGYAAPGEQTIRAATRIGDGLHRALAQAWEDGHLDPAPALARDARLSPGTRAQLEQLRQRRGYGGPVGLTAATIDAFVAVHGFVVMEVFGQLRPITPDAGPYFEEVLAEQAQNLGLRNPDDDVERQSGRSRHQ